AKKFGKSTVVVSIDFKRNQQGKNEVFSTRGTKSTGLDPILWAKEVERFVLQEEIETFYSQAVQLAPEDQPLRLEHLKQFIGWTEQKYEIGARAEDALKECNAMLRAKTTDAQLQFIKDWAIQFMEFYGEDPFSKEAQNPFYI
ncbi:MAG: HisA/HisF-related TIM barrel protein, partial [Nanoarchaeota archaeon]